MSWSFTILQKCLCSKLGGGQYTGGYRDGRYADYKGGSSVHWGMLSILRGALNTLENIMRNVGDIMSTQGDV